MKTIKVTLSFGEVELTPEDIKALRSIIDREFYSLDETKYKRLKWSTPSEIKEALEAMPDKELLDFARLNDQYREDEMREMLEECKLQLEYLQNKFGETGTGNNILSRLGQLLDPR